MIYYTLFVLILEKKSCCLQKAALVWVFCLLYFNTGTWCKISSSLCERRAFSLQKAHLSFLLLYVVKVSAAPGGYFVVEQKLCDTKSQEFSTMGNLLWKNAIKLVKVGRGKTRLLLGKCGTWYQNTQMDLDWHRMSYYMTFQLPQEVLQLGRRHILWTNVYLLYNKNCINLFKSYTKLYFSFLHVPRQPLQLQRGRFYKLWTKRWQNPDLTEKKVDQL